MTPSLRRSAGMRALRAGLGRALALLTLLALLPLALVTAMLVFVTLGRPLLFRQRRSGLHGQAFVLWKFRTMREARDARGELLPDALRQTALTRLLRATRLDEVPQLLAIFRGQMALVGPRPLLPETIAGFGALGAVRSSVLPGLTGWAQVNGNTCLSDREKLALDLWYVENRSFALDCRILALTVLVILTGERRNLGNLEKARPILLDLEATTAASVRP